MRVLYFTIVPLMDDSNGGNMCCRNHVRRLSQDPNIELFVLWAGEPAHVAGTAAFLAEIGVPFETVAFEEGDAHPRDGSPAALAEYAEVRAYHHPWELRALNQHHVQEAADRMIAAQGIDCVVADYLQSALFVDLGRRDVRTALVTLNREDSFYRDLISLGLTPHPPEAAEISHRRLVAFERATYARVGKVIAIGPPDMPTGEVRSPPAYITPYFDPRPEPWRHSGTRNCLFVGNIGHYPNRLAANWLTRELAPRLHGIAPDIRITIVGATPDQIPPEDRHPNLECLGIADAATVEALMRTADLMLCPVENDYGVKFKAVQALSYGIPLLASRQTMCGFPHLRNLPVIDLDRPEEAAAVIRHLLSVPETLKAVQQRQTAHQAAFIASQSGVWSRTLREIPA